MWASTLAAADPARELVERHDQLAGRRRRQRHARSHDGNSPAHAVAGSGKRNVARDERAPPEREVQQVPALGAVGLPHDALHFDRVEQIGLGAEAPQLGLRQLPAAVRERARRPARRIPACVG